MKKRVIPRDFIIYLILLSVMFIILADSTFKLNQINYNIRIVLLITIITIVYLWIATTYRYSFLSILLILIPFKPSSIISFFKLLIFGWRNFVASVVTNQFVSQEFAGYYTNLIFVLLVLILILFYFVVVIKKNTGILLIFGCTIFVTYYFLGIGSVFKSCGTYLIFNLILYAFNEYLKKKDKWSYEDTEVRRNYFYRWLSLTVILVIFTNFLVQLLPYNAKPVTFNWFENNILRSFEGINGIGGRTLSNSGLKSQFRLYSTGYQQNSKQLGGPVKLDDSTAFLISSSDSIGGLHLRGSVDDLYNGSSWSKSDSTTQRVQDQIGDDSLQLPYTLKAMDIFPRKTITTTAFNALYPFTVDNRWKYVYVDSDMEIFNPQSVKSGDSYEVTFKEFDINETKNRLKGLNYNPKTTIYDDKLEKYLKLPVLPDEVYSLTEDIISQYKTPYEKASAIEYYLKTHYSYSTDTAFPSPNEDFVDNFLFKEKKGYCTYFASAMAVMCRIANIPSRYVEGFVVPESTGTEGRIEVLNSDAHAWVELYFQNIGWVTFDPTPGMASMAMDLKQQNNVSDNNNSTTITPGSQTVRPTPTRPNIPKDNASASSPGKTVEKNSSAVPLYIAAGILAILIIIVGILIINALLYKQRNFLAYSLQRIIFLGGIAGFSYKKGCTLREYFEKFSKEFGIDLMKLTVIFENILYSPETPGSADVKTINNAANRVKKYLISDKGRFKFYFLNAAYIFYIPLHNKQIKKLFNSKESN